MTAWALRLTHGRAAGRRLRVLLVIAVTLGAALAVQRLEPAIPTLLAAAGLATVCGVLATTRRIEVTLAALMIYIGLFDGSLRLLTGYQNLTLARDVILYSIVAGVLVRAIVQRRAIPVPPLAGWVVFFVAAVVVQLPNPANVSVFQAIGSTRPHLEFVPLFFLGYMVMTSRRRVRSFLVLLVALAAINGIVAFVQYQITPEQLAAWGPGYDALISGDAVSERVSYDPITGEVFNRPPALGADSGFGGVLGLLAAPAMLALVSLGVFRGRRRYAVLALALAGCIVLGIFASQARVAIVGAVIAAAAFAVLSASTRRLAANFVAVGAGVAIIAVVVSALGTTTIFNRFASVTPDKVVETTIEYRQDTLAAIPEYAVDHPLGAGLGQAGPGARLRTDGVANLNAESQFTYMIIELGLPGLVACFGLTLLVLGMGVRVVRRVRDPELRTLLAALVAPIVAVLPLWLLGPTTVSPPMAPFFWFVAGALGYWHVVAARASAAPPRPAPPVVAGTAPA